jgi:uncharacterized membrane protein HdeD (DUF308 family)
MEVRYNDVQIYNQLNRKGKAMLFTSGIALLLLGVFAIVSSLASTVVDVLALGWIFILASIFQFIFAFTTGKWFGFFLHLLLATLYCLEGLYFVLFPYKGIDIVTMLVAFLFFISGILRILASFSMKYGGKGWALLSGALTTGLGIYILYYLPQIGSILLGTLIGVDILLFGIYLITFGVVFRAAPYEKRRVRRSAHA